MNNIYNLDDKFYIIDYNTFILYSKNEFLNIFPMFFLEN